MLAACCSSQVHESMPLSPHLPTSAHIPQVLDAFLYPQRDAASLLMRSHADPGLLTLTLASDPPGRHVERVVLVAPPLRHIGLLGMAPQAAGCAMHSGRAAEPLRAPTGGCGAAVGADPKVSHSAALPPRPGLQVLDRCSGVWTEVEALCVAGDLIVLCGEALELVSGGRCAA